MNPNPNFEPEFCGTPAGPGCGMKENAESLRAMVADLRKADPAFFAAWKAFMDAALAPDALTLREKELIALGIAIAAHCSYCIGSHVRNCKEAGVTEAEISCVAHLAMKTPGVALVLTQVFTDFDDAFSLYYETPWTGFRSDTLSPREKVLIGLGIAIHAHDKRAIESRVRDCLACEVTKAELLSTGKVAMLMGGGPSFTTLADVRDAMKKFYPEREHRRVKAK